MSNLAQISSSIFHIYNRSNDRKELFQTDDNYQIFLSKVARQLRPVAHLLAYCVMPNHFHILLSPKHPIREGYILSSKPQALMPTEELGEAVKNLLMGYSKSYNKFYGLDGSRFKQHTQCVHHQDGVSKGLSYVHDNPVTAKLVSHPSEWPYSSLNAFYIKDAPEEWIVDVALVKALLDFERA